MEADFNRATAKIQNPAHYAPQQNRADGRRRDKDPRPEQSEREHRRRRWKFRLRPDDDDEPQDWWFAAIAIPLLAATTGPLANLLSIAAIVTSWRNVIPDNGAGSDADSVGFPDPHWCIALNVASLVCGFVGNFSLLLNFTRGLPYIIALPITIILWYIATAILISIVAAMHIHVPPIRPQQTYSQGFWYAIIAAILYLLSSMALMVNMLGYFLGHYPRHFTLTDHQRTLIVQTMAFFIWLAGGAGIFSRVCGWAFADALYFCDVTILTVGFGDFYSTNDAGRWIVFPFSIGGIIMLGLVVSSIHRFMRELSNDNVIKKHVEKQRVRTIGRSVTRSIDLPRARVLEHVNSQNHHVSELLSTTTNRDILFQDAAAQAETEDPTKTKPGVFHRMTNSKIARQVLSPRQPKILLLKEEKDRFDAMRHVQQRAQTFRRWYNLFMSVSAFGLLWCLGAVVFWRAEQREQHLSYFQAIYFCYVSLLTIGYGDLSPKSNAGKSFFVVWSLIAVPSITILIGDMADTVIAGFNRGTFTLADWTVLPKAGLWKAVLARNPWLLLWLQQKVEERAAEKRVEEGFVVQGEEGDTPPTLEELARDADADDGDGVADERHHVRSLTAAVRRTAHDLRLHPPKKYSYEEWAEFTRLIRYSWESRWEVEREEETEGMIYWDWIGEDSPMMADMTEPEWVLEKLCGSMDHFFRRKYQSRKKHHHVKHRWRRHGESVLPGGGKEKDGREEGSRSPSLTVREQETDVG
ncbi:MAG: Potassium channel [Peltula sp. TS41687]|nr:MAG: Potassium channel [Peltula sp. TS41687]